MVYKRYYHLFKKDELEEIVKQAAKEGGICIKIVESFYEHQNWVVRVEKINKNN